MFLNENDDVPFKALKYCIGECNAESYFYAFCSADYVRDNHVSDAITEDALRMPRTDEL